MRKIILSLSVIAFVAAIAIIGTVAYYTDTEKSTGNTFTAGSIDLKIDNECYYNGEKCIYDKGTDKYYWGGVPEYDVAGNISNQCYCAWMPEKDLVPGEDYFFMFHDLKPGDSGEDTLSLHVIDNDAWVCAEIEITKNDDMTCTEPELENDADPTCVDPGTNWDGDLAQELDFIFWLDDGDNVLEDDELEGILMGGPVSALPGEKVVFPIADSRNSIIPGGGPLIGCEVYHIGKAWCFGDFGNFSETAVPAGEGEDPTVDSGITCSGKLVNNASQSDTVMGNVSFTAVQYRNNTDYVCVPGAVECEDDGDCPDDGNQCTVAFCDTDGTCQHRCLVGAACDDGNACTDPDVCTDVDGCPCVGEPICAGTDTHCGCEICVNCNDRDGWVNVGDPYACCQGDYNLCNTCQNQEYIDYSCEGNVCVSETTDWRTNASDCFSCYPCCCVNAACDVCPPNND